MYPPRMAPGPTVQAARRFGPGLAAASLVAAALIGTPARGAPSGSDVLRPTLATTAPGAPLVAPELVPDVAVQPRPRLTPLQYAARRARSARHRAERAIRRREAEIRAWRRAADVAR